jgi:hypothetical protein
VPCRTILDRAVHENYITQLRWQRNYSIEACTACLRTVSAQLVLCDRDQRRSETIEMKNRNSTSHSSNKKQIDFSVSKFWFQDFPDVIEDIIDPS